jgi:hypothetical protein
MPPSATRLASSARQLAALVACLDADGGSMKVAAHDFGVDYWEMRELLHRLYRDLGVTTQAQAVAALYQRCPDWRENATK